jgi:hypothetical protein
MVKLVRFVNIHYSSQPFSQILLQTTDKNSGSNSLAYFERAYKKKVKIKFYIDDYWITLSAPTINFLAPRQPSITTLSITTASIVTLSLSILSFRVKSNIL